METENKRAVRPKRLIVRCIVYEEAAWILRVDCDWMVTGTQDVENRGVDVLLSSSQMEVIYSPREDKEKQPEINYRYRVIVPLKSLTS